MSEKKTQPKNNTIIPNDGSYLGAKKAQAIKAKKIQQEFINYWNSQKTLLKDSTVKLFKDKNSIGVQWQTYVDWDNTKLIKPRRIKRSLNSLGRGKFPHTAKAVSNAIAISQEINNKIKADAFNWLDYPQWIPKEFRPLDKTKRYCSPQQRSVIENR